jgi:alanine racemase
MPRPLEALIHTEALAHNLQRARHHAPDAKVWAVVKANAYGHRLELAFEGLRGADGFAVLDLGEAERVRALGWRGPVLLLEGCFEARDLERCSRLGLWHVVHREAQIDWLAVHKTTWPQHVYLKMNSGMNRLGFAPETYRSAWLRLSGLTQVDEITLMTHFANADFEPALEAAGLSVATQHQRFEALTHDLPGDRSLCNSAATLRYCSSDAALRGDWVRPGIMLYGASPDYPAHSAQDWGLRPAMSLRSQLVAVQNVQAGEHVGYGSTYTADRPMRVGVVACGYADGYPRAAPTGTPVLVQGLRTRLVGRVSMDMVTVDLTGLPETQQQAPQHAQAWAQTDVGSEVTLWGQASTGEVLSVDEVAHAAGTVGYELVCALTPRVPARAVD